MAALLIVGAVSNKGKGFGFSRPRFHSPPWEVGGGKVRTWEKPEGFKIIGLIFFGRPSVVEILDCYLKKNLVSRGGWMDEVHFVVNTENQDDIRYLDSLVEGEELYEKIVISSLGYNEVWAAGVERGTLYIKIDDDIVCAFFNMRVCGYVFEGLTKVNIGLFQR